MQNKNIYELRYYNNNKHYFDAKKEYNICGYYKLRETSKTLLFVFLQEKQHDPRIPKNKDLKFLKSKGWTLEKLLFCFYPKQEGIPFWFFKQS